jgi:hypothetical protein
MKFWLFLLAGFALGTAVVAQEDIWSKTINNDENGNWYVTPDKPKPKYFEVKEIPGGHAFRVKANKGANPWDVQASSPVNGAINEGDVIMLMYYARAARTGRRRQLADRAHPGHGGTMDCHHGHDLEDHRGMEKLLRAPRRQRHARQEQRIDPPGHGEAGDRARAGVRVQLRQGIPLKPVEGM